MDTLTILFVGLIAHVMTDGGAQRAVLVAAPQHEARLIVDVADVIENRGFERDANGAFKLEGEAVTIEGIAKGDASFEASYLRNVPSLSRISNGTRLIPEIESASPHEAVAAYVDTGAGTFSASDTYPQQAAFGSFAQCLAKNLSFRVAATAATVTFATASGKRLRVRAGATVRISNVPPNAGTGSHFHAYLGLLRDGTNIAEPIPAGTSCSIGRRRVATHDVASDGLGVGCSNTQWP